jgi:hypothetical protein
MGTEHHMMPLPARWLGAAGIVPAAAAVALCLAPLPPEIKRLAVQAGAVYAGLVLSFLGGCWWAFAARGGEAGWSLWVLAVLPSLAAWALLMALAPARIVALGVLVIVSLVVDRLLVVRSLAPGWWMQLRVPLSLGLGGLAILLGVLASRLGA